MRDKKISIIIPVYNTAEYLPKCLDSVCKQTYDNIEIICVDDGSTDGADRIVDEYAGCDTRFVVIHQENKGESNARNVGLLASTGDYIAFVDCDDWIEPDMYENLVNVLEENNLDLAASGWYKEECEPEVRTLEVKNELPVDKGIIGRDEFLNYLYRRDSYRGFAYMWNKLYKREILKDKEGNLLLFDETLKLGGDVLWLAEAVLNIGKAQYMDRAFYHYNQRSSSGCHTKDLLKLHDWLKAYERVLERFEQEAVPLGIVSYVKRFLAYHSSNAAQSAYEQREKWALEIFQRYMCQYENEYTTLNEQYPERLSRYRMILSYEI